MKDIKYRLSPKGCLYCGILDAGEEMETIMEPGDDGEELYIDKYIDLVYKKFENYMMTNNYRIINLDDFERAGLI